MGVLVSRPAGSVPIYTYTAPAIPSKAATPMSTLSLCASPRLSVHAADTLLMRNLAPGLSSDGAPKITYEDGVAWRALEMVYDMTRNESYVAHITKSINNVIDQKTGALLDYNLTYYTLDDIRIGETMIWLHQKTKATKYKTAADELHHQLAVQPRNKLGGYWHRSTYPYQMWLDGLYMVEPFYTKYTKTYQTANTTAYDDIMTQFELTLVNCQNNKTDQFGLLKHGYDESHTASWADEATGASPEVWNRALGWYVMAIVDVLDDLPDWHMGRAYLIILLNENAAAIKKAVDPSSKMWWLVMGRPNEGDNYIESSGAAMFVYAIFKGIRMGYLDSATYKSVAQQAYESMIPAFVMVEQDGGLGWNGTVSVGSLGGDGDFDYYVSVATKKDDLKGYGPFIMAATEYERAICT